MLKERLRSVTALPENGHVRGRKKGQSPFTTQDHKLWNYAVRNDMLPKLIGSGIMTEEELDALQNFFERQEGARRPSEGLLNKLSLGVVRYFE